MRHLSDSELVDAVERRLSGARLEHAEQCPGCRDKADRLRAALELVEVDPASEPSPLFWAHFGSRVQDAIRGESFDRPPAAWRGWIFHPGALTAAAAAILAVGLTVATRNAHVTPAAPTAAIAPAATHQESPLVDADDDLDADAAWAVVRTAADEFDWEDAHAAGLQAQPGSSDRMALELTEAERVELIRIVEREMKRSGA